MTKPRFEYGSDTLGIVLGWARTRRLAEEMAEAEQHDDPNLGQLYIDDRLARRGQPNRWLKPRASDWCIAEHKPVAPLAAADRRQP
jgi:hypothetical protein